MDLLTDTTGCYEILNTISETELLGEIDPARCGNDENTFLFTKTNNQLKDSGNRTSTYTAAISFSFPFPLSLNLGWGLSSNSPNDLRQSETVITVLSSKLGYKFFENKFNVTIGGNYVIAMKEGNGFWDSGEIIIIDDDGTPEQFNQGDTFIDKIELDNNKLTLKTGMQYKIPDKNIAIGLNLDYTKAIDNLATTQADPIFKAKIAIKYGF